MIKTTINESLKTNFVTNSPYLSLICTTNTEGIFQETE